VPPEEENNIRRVFNLARQDIAGFDYYAGQIAKLFVGNPAMLEDVLDGLFEIAKADGVLHPRKPASWNGWRRYSVSLPMNSAVSAPAISRPN
jgi:DnaJ like chaperone protein